MSNSALTQAGQAGNAGSGAAVSVAMLREHPLFRQMLLLAGIAVAVAIGLFAYRWSAQPAYAPLGGTLSEADTALGTNALRTAGVPFRVDTGGGGLMVPADRLSEARLALAGEGLPRSSGSGFEMMQQEQGFGTSSFIENARYQHALETELARTIAAMQPVRSARVHLAIPKPSAFVRRDSEPSASVLVSLHPGRMLERPQVASIVHMVASSVPGMRPSAVTVIDQAGALLSTSDDNPALAKSAEQFEYTRQMQEQYAQRIEQLLLPIAGHGRVSTQVALDLDFSETEEAQERYADPPKVRSEQTREESRRGQASAQGVPGALSNQPAESAAQTAGLAEGATADPLATINTTSQATRSYELDRTLSHTRRAVGEVRRLSVAVLIDHVPRPKTGGAPGEMERVPLSDAERARVLALVKEAVGFDEARGDRVTVENVPFLQQELPDVEPLPVWERPQFMDMVRQGGGWLLVLLLILFVLRPVLRSLLNTPLRAQFEALHAQTEMSAIAAQPGQVQPMALESAQPVQLPRSGYEQKLDTARAAVVQDPKRVAQVMRTWIGTEG